LGARCAYGLRSARQISCPEQDTQTSRRLPLSGLSRPRLLFQHPACHGEHYLADALAHSLDGRARRDGLERARDKQQHFGQRMLDYYTLLRRSTSLPVLPYAVLLYPGRPALGYRTYEEQFRGRTVTSLTYFQVSL